MSAQAKFSNNVLVASSKSSADTGTTYRSLPLDSTLASASINLTYNGAQGDFTFSVLKPDGTDSGLTFTCEGSASCSTEMDESFFNLNGYGEYQVQLVNNTGIANDVTMLVSATPSGSETYDIAIGFSSTTVSYPRNMALMATVKKGSAAVSGLDVTAIITDPLNNVSQAQLLDDGEGADLLADDGTYTYSIPYSSNGAYSAIVTASNTAGAAATTSEGILISVQEDGSASGSPNSELITENFTRSGAASASVSGAAADDHADNPASGLCTLITDDNGDVPGRMDFAGDMDCFTFIPSSVTSPLVIRVTSLTSGMEPVLTVYDNTGTVQITQVDLFTSENPESGVVVTINTADIDAAGMIFSVNHENVAATIGGYMVSVGEALISDVRKGGAVDEELPSYASDDDKLIDCFIQSLQWDGN